MNKNYILLIFSIFCSLLARAQYVTIPDSTLRVELQNRYPACFNGAGMMDTTCTNIVNELALEIHAHNLISNFSGLQYFDNVIDLRVMNTNASFPAVFPSHLKTLYIEYSNSTTTPVLPQGLTELTINSCAEVTGLPAFPASLLQISLTDLGITTLPALPPGLTRLNCTETQISSLPSLPAGLEFMNVNRNQLTTLPVIPAGLTYLDANYNQISTLPSLPERLQTLYIGINQFTNLPAHLPDSLTGFMCSSNQLTSLPTLPSKLTALYAENNLLTSLPVLPDSLRIIYCQVNALHDLPALPSNLETLLCDHNQLTNIPVLPPRLNRFVCRDNLLTSLPALPGNLTSVDCANNSITILPALPSTLTNLRCENNPINCLPLLPPFIDITIDGPITCIPNASQYYINQHTGLNDWDTDPLPYCSPVTNTYHCESYPVITGHVYNDNNNNLVKDANEPYRSNIRIELSGGHYTYTNSDGYFAIAANGTGAVTATVTAPDFYTSVPMQYNYNFSSYDTLVMNDFALQATTVKDSLAISITAMSPARPGRSIPYEVHYENAGTTSLPANIVVNYDNSLLIYDSCSNSSVTNSGTSLNLSQSPFVAGQENDFTAYFTVRTTAAMNDAVITSASISSGAITISDTSKTMVTTSYDPNDKLATDTLTPQQVALGDYIYYTIRFQNTGNDTAFNVVITDTLSSDLQATSFKMINSSHPCKTIVNGNAIVFELLNIMLPDSNVNEIKSHGFVSFKIKPESTVSLNSSIPNNAAIYFDYNSPVITNTAVTQIAERQIPTPFGLLSFTVTKRPGNNASASWSTINEINTKEFSVEISIDGSVYNSAGMENAKKEQYNSYSREILLPLSNTIYVRLKTINNDNHFEYSPVVILQNNTTNEVFSIANNPVKNNLVIMLNDVSLRNSVFTIINSQGAVVHQGIIKNDTENIDVSKFPSGIYILKTKKESSPFIISK